MAYVATKTASEIIEEGRRYTIYTVVETGVTLTTHEYTIDVPRVGTVTHVSSVLTAGNGNATTIDPQIGEATGTGSASVYENGAAAASVRADPDARYYTASQTLYCRSVANGTTGTTGNITTTIVVAAGHD